MSIQSINSYNCTFCYIISWTMTNRMGSENGRWRTTDELTAKILCCLSRFVGAWNGGHLKHWWGEKNEELKEAAAAALQENPAAEP